MASWLLILGAGVTASPDWEAVQLNRCLKLVIDTSWLSWQYKYQSTLKSWGLKRDPEAQTQGLWFIWAVADSIFPTPGLWCGDWANITTAVEVAAEPKWPGHETRHQHVSHVMLLSLGPRRKWKYELVVINIWVVIRDMFVRWRKFAVNSSELFRLGYGWKAWKASSFSQVKLAKVKVLQLQRRAQGRWRGDEVTTSRDDFVWISLFEAKPCFGSFEVCSLAQRFGKIIIQSLLL